MIGAGMLLFCSEQYGAGAGTNALADVFSILSSIMMGATLLRRAVRGKEQIL
jgi:hypothetical protein